MINIEASITLLSKRTSLCKPCTSSCWLTQHCLAVTAYHYSLRVAKDGGSAIQFNYKYTEKQKVRIFNNRKSNYSHVKAALTFYILYRLEWSKLTIINDNNKNNGPKSKRMVSLPWKRNWEIVRDAWAYAFSSQLPAEDATSPRRFGEPIKQKIIHIKDTSKFSIFSEVTGWGTHHFER